MQCYAQLHWDTLQSTKCRITIKAVCALLRHDGCHRVADGVHEWAAPAWHQICISCGASACSNSRHEDHLRENDWCIEAGVGVLMPFLIIAMNSSAYRFGKNSLALD